MAHYKLSDIIEIPDGPEFEILHTRPTLTIGLQSRILRRTGGGRWRPHLLEKPSVVLSSVWMLSHHEKVLETFLRLAPRAGDLKLWAYKNLEHSFGPVYYGPAYKQIRSLEEALTNTAGPSGFLSMQDAKVLIDRFGVTEELALRILEDSLHLRANFRIAPVDCIDLFKEVLPEDFFASGIERPVRLRKFLAWAEVTPTDLLQELLEDEDEEVALAALTNPNSWPGTHRMLEAYHTLSTQDSEEPESPLMLIQGDTSDFFKLLNRPDFPFEDLLGCPVPENSRWTILANSDRPPVRMYVASHKSVPADIKLQLARRPGHTPEDNDIKVALAHSSLDHPEVLQVLMNDPSEVVSRVSTGQYMHHLLTHRDYLTSYGAILSWQEDLTDLWSALDGEFPDIDGISPEGYSLNFQARPYGFHVLPDGRAKIYLENSYDGHDTEDESEDDLWNVVQSYEWKDWNEMMVRGLEKKDPEKVRTTFPLAEAFTETNLSGSGTQFDERVITALITHGQLGTAVGVWLDHVMNWDLWSLLLRPFRVMGAYKPHTREQFETALAVPEYFESMEWGLKYGFEHSWDELENTPEELLAASEFARRHGRADLADAVAALASA